MRLAIVIMVAAVLVACHRHTLPQSSAQVQKSDSVTVMYFYHDTVITAAPDSAAIHDTIPCPMDYAHSVQDGRQTLTVKAHGGKLDVTCSSDSLQKVIQVLSEKITASHREQVDSTIVITKTVKVPIARYPSLFWWSIGINILLLVVIYFELSTGGAVSGLVSDVIKLISKLF